MVNKFSPPLSTDLQTKIGDRYGTGFYPRIVEVLKSTTKVHDWIIVLGGSIDINMRCENGELEGKDTSILD